MAVRDDFSPGEVLTSSDLNDTFASKLPYSYGTATPSTSVDGFLWYDENDTPPTPKFWDGAAFQAIGGGTILQIVRATDTTDSSTTSTSYVDVTGMSVTITPTKSTSTLLLVSTASCRVFTSGGSAAGFVQLSDNSNNPVSGAEEMRVQETGSANSLLQFPMVLVGYVTPATTSAVTYKMRFRAQGSGQTIYVFNSDATGQMYAIEVSA